MPTDYKKEWIEKSSIDYFSPFISLWLACNSWYQSHYSDIKNGTDREFINKIKDDDSGRNHLYGRYCDLIDKNDKAGIAFRTYIELLHYALERADLRPDKIDSCSFRRAVTDYNNRSSLEDLIVEPRFLKNGSIRAADAFNVVKLDEKYITSNNKKFFAGLFEIIYQVRNMLVHGKLNPGKDEHEVVKYCYLILWDLMN